nr:uncharacterized protein CTRU02_13566 [Colletotrichum truncatum]KAF6783330.1 hypothetical protein CTRU02_13566 [Colletotrichum truncatum]
MGNQNCHAEIIFEDGVKWLARFRLPRTTSPPQEVRDFILHSEVATMSYLQQHTRLPTPKIFDWACESDPGNQLGVSYILMEKLDGRPLDWQTASSSQREKIMQQLVDVFLEIDKHPFESMGSLTMSNSVPGSFDMQGFAQQSTYWMGAGRGLGPFSSPLDGYRAIVESNLSMIASGELAAYYPLEAYLTHRFRLDVIGSLWKDISSRSQFFLKHPDDKGDHILVNDTFDIVGIIDWEWTCVVSRAEAFSSPLMMWPVTKFYNSLNELSPDELRFAEIFRERGRQDLSDCILDGRKIQRFLFALGLETPRDERTIIDLFKGLQRAFGYEDEAWQVWKYKVLKEWKDDKLLQILLEPSEN